MRSGAGSLPRPVGVPPAVARAECPCRFTAKMAVPQRAGRMPAPQKGSADVIAWSNTTLVGAEGRLSHIIATAVGQG